MKTIARPKFGNRSEPLQAFIRQINMDSKTGDTPEKRKARLRNYIKVMQEFAQEYA